MTKNEKFTKIYEEYSNLVYQYAVARTSDEDLSMEFVQQVFVSFYEHMDKVPQDIVKPWLLLSCKHEMIDYFRKTEIKGRSYSYNTDIRVEDDIITEDNTERIVENIVKGEFTFDILVALKEKNESWYRIIEAVGIFEMSQEEAAEYLGMSVQVLRAKLYRARKYIRKKYGDRYLEL